MGAVPVWSVPLAPKASLSQASYGMSEGENHSLLYVMYSRKWDEINKITKVIYFLPKSLSRSGLNWVNFQRNTHSNLLIRLSAWNVEINECHFTANTEDLNSWHGKIMAMTTIFSMVFQTEYVGHLSIFVYLYVTPPGNTLYLSKCLSQHQWLSYHKMFWVLGKNVGLK